MVPNEPYAEITEIGTVSNSNTYKVLDSNGNDVSDNYDIDYINGILEKSIEIFK